MFTSAVRVVVGSALTIPAFALLMEVTLLMGLVVTFRVYDLGLRLKVWV